MTLILNNDEVERVLTMEDCLEVLEEAFKDLGREAAVNQIRVHTYVSMEQSAISYRLKTGREDLKGKKFAISRFGSGSDFALRWW